MGWRRGGFCLGVQGSTGQMWHGHPGHVLHGQDARAMRSSFAPRGLGLLVVACYPIPRGGMRLFSSKSKATRSREELQKLKEAPTLMRRFATGFPTWAEKGPPAMAID